MMKRGLFFLLSAALLAGRAAAQDASVQDDMRFVEELRKQGKSDLALEYLQRLEKTASGDLAKALPLEMARTKLEAAGEEPDSGKRLALYGDAHDAFQKWLSANPGDPHVNEVKLDLAHVAIQQGRTQLSRALLNEDFESMMTPEAGQARASFEDAAVQLKNAAKALDDQIAKAGEPKTPAEKELKKKLDNDRLEADLDLARNLFDQAETYPPNSQGDLLKARNKLYQDAQALFEKLADKDDQNSICWTAKAWAGRCIHMLDDLPKAKARYKVILAASSPNAAEAKRLAGYFNLLLLQKAPAELRDKTENEAHIIEMAKTWLEKPGYVKTPEGNGMRFLLAEEYVAVAATDKDAGKRNANLNEARRYYRQVEESENDFTDRARRRKIEVIATQQGGFKEPVGQLRTFEDCYVRAQYEMMQEAKDEKAAKTPEEAEKARKDHGTVVTAALERGLKLARDAPHGDEAMELANAKAMMAYQYMNAKKYREAIAVGEKYARGAPRSSQAAITAVYVLQCYAEMVGQEEAAASPPAELTADQKGLLDFAQYMEKNWAKEPAGDVARHQLGLRYVNAPVDVKETDPVQREAAIKLAHIENVHKAIDALSQITPTYGNYTLSQYQLAQFCFAAEKEDLQPMPGDGPDGYHNRALAALKRIPPLEAGADPTTNKVYFMANYRLAQEYSTQKSYAALEKISDEQLALLKKGVAVDPDDKKNQDQRGEFADVFNSYRVLAHWGQAAAEATAAEKADAKDKPAHYAKVLEALDPIVEEIDKKEHPELKNNQQLARGVLDNALRATIALNKLDQTQKVLDGYKELATSDSADAGAAEVLKELVAFIPPQLEELKHTGDAAALDAAKKKFGEILTNTLKPLQGDKLTPQLIAYTARLYSSMDQHKEAADLLEKVAEPSADAPDTDKNTYHGIRLQLARERRFNGEKETARKLMNEMMGDAKKPGWGRKELPVLIENIELLGAEGDNKSAAEIANGLAQKLLPKIDTDPRLKEDYVQCCFLTVENVYRQAAKVKEKTPDKYAMGVKTAAGLAVELARKQNGFVSDASRLRFRDLMDAEPDLKADFLDGYLSAVENMDKQNASSDAAALIVELEKMWPDYGGDAAKDRITALLGHDAVKTAYSRLKGDAAP
jgi:hypothetical protein